ncbi:helix-turn-helix transcriptional regulator [Methanoregula formicica]|uniref:Putative transcriptional regulator n=1 Tax=Methanoregula formicica (strain DSM 22288 / NBRC 105244 / SMSP) TaxID=593750 RepID=L0HE76_METFS|nr:winged helix-turn-helix domain-containing protein [Methanoregula formicica]AGB01618.1 putative transcriptional regulator [Methanoregula formicica SMSP]
MSDLLAVTTSSEKRKRLLLFLAAGPRTWDEIKDTLHVTATGILPQIKILEDQKLLCREGRQFYLTETGQLIVRFLGPFDGALAVLGQQRKFWEDHNIHALPEEFLLRIGELEKIQIIECCVEDSFEPHTEFIASLQQASRIKGISPIVHPRYPNLFLNLAKENKSISLILTKSAFEKIKREYYNMLMEGLGYANASLFIYPDDIHFAYIVTDYCFSISFFLNNGLFDSKQDLISTSKSALRFGEDLFTFYQNRSERLNA